MIPREDAPTTTLVPIAIIAAVGLAAYSNSFAVPFQFDDLHIIQANRTLHMARLDWGSIARACGGFPTNRWLAALTFALNYRVGGLEVAGFHAVNLLFHLAASVMVWLLGQEILARTTSLDGPARRRVALVAALLFVAHPVQTQAVTYVVQRQASMGAFFGFAAAWLYARSRRDDATRRWGWRAGAALGAAAAFSCKENFAVLPLLAVAFEWACIPGFRERIRAAWIPLAAGGVAAAVAGALLYGRYAPDFQEHYLGLGLSLGERLLSQPRVLWHYLSLLALPLPSRLHVDYAWPPSTGPLSPMTTLPSVAGLLGLLGLAAAARRRWPLVAFAIAWFLGALVVEQSIIPLDLAFEHRLYFPSFGLLLLAAAGLALAARRLGRPFALELLTGLLVLALGLGTWLRNAEWSDPVALYSDPESVGPGHARALAAVAGGYAARGEAAKAEEILQRGYALDPANPGFSLDLGIAARGRGDLAGAERWWRNAVRLSPGYGDPWALLGELCFETGRLREAAEAYEAAVRIDPTSAPFQVNLGQVYEALGDRASAARHFDEAVRLDPLDEIARRARSNLGASERR